MIVLKDDSLIEVTLVSERKINFTDFEVKEEIRMFDVFMEI